MNYKKFLKESCEKCDSTTHLVIHHKDINHNNNNSENLQTLCRMCHNELHVNLRGQTLSIPNIPEIWKDGDFVEVYFPRPLPAKLNLFLFLFLGCRRGNKVFLKSGCKKERVVGFRCYRKNFEDLRTKL